MSKKPPNGASQKRLRSLIKRKGLDTKTKYSPNRLSNKLFIFMFPFLMLVGTLLVTFNLSTINQKSVEDNADVTKEVLGANTETSLNAENIQELSEQFNKTREILLTKEITLDYNEVQTKKYATSEKTVKEFLDSQNYAYDSDDIVTPSLDTEITEAMNIQVVTVTTNTREEIISIPFTTSTQNDPEMIVGESTVIQNGVNGQKKLIYQTTTESGTLKSEELLSEEILSNPQEQIIVKGTKRPKQKLSIGEGQEFEYCSKKTMRQTSYTPNCLGCNGLGITATGHELAYGMVAVDPNVIPLYTEVYIPGYGKATALDTGGLIKGNKIDLGFASVEQRNQLWNPPASGYGEVYIACD